VLTEPCSDLDRAAKPRALHLHGHTVFEVLYALVLLWQHRDREVASWELEPWLKATSVGESNWIGTWIT
jgi:hypothetical protein